MLLVFKPGKELTLLEKNVVTEIGKKQDKWELESKEKVWNNKRKTWTNPTSQTGYMGPTVREI